MSLPILFLLTLVAVVFEALLLVEKNNTITNLESEIESLKKKLCDLELAKAKMLEKMNQQQIADSFLHKRFAEEIENNFKNMEALREKYKIESQKERKNLMGRLNYAKNKLEEEREKKQEAIKAKKQLDKIVSKLEKEKKMIQKDFEFTINNKSLTIDKQNEKLANLENELNKVKGDYQSVFVQNEESKNHVDSLEKKNKELENLISELKKQKIQTKREFKNVRSQMLDENDNPFERMSLW